MVDIPKVVISKLPAADRRLARAISRSETLGDPDRSTLSALEVRRAWAELEPLGPEDRATLTRLSAQLGVEVPASQLAKVTRVLGPPGLDGATGVLRRTRIIATLGPASSDVTTLVQMIQAGMDVARLNFSHISDEATARRYCDALRQAMEQTGRTVQILGDLPGPKVRVGALATPVTVATGEKLLLCPVGEEGPGRLSIAPASLLQDLKEGDRAFIDDGKVALRVTGKRGNLVETEVLRGGTITSHKGLNLPDTRLAERVPTAGDLAAIAIMKAVGIDLVAVSFVEDGTDLSRVRSQFERPVRLVAKVERPVALSHLEDIYRAADAVMVARGDLGVELGAAEVPVAQHRMHLMGNRLGVVTGTATEMLASMTSGGEPTRAEASDVYRSVLEGAEFVMTSGETATGADPVGTVAMMSSLLVRAEAGLDQQSTDSVFGVRASDDDGR